MAGYIGNKAVNLSTSGADISGTANLDIIDVDGAANFAADVTFADGADIITASAGTANFRAGVNAGNSIASGGNYNVVVGDEAGTALTTGDQNVFIGYKAGEDLTTGTDNTFVGNEAGKNTTDRNHNTAIGNEALLTNVNGAKNAALGSGALLTMNPATDADTFNVAVGYEAGRNVTTGINNTLIGGLAGDAITTGSQITAIGQHAAGKTTTASNNTAIGRTAMYDNTTGASNVAVGTDALYSNTTASNNTAVGYKAGYANTTGTSNNFFGFQAGQANTTAGSNTAMGHNTFSANTTGAGNCAFGIQTLMANTTANYNTAMGFNALTANTTGTENVSIGGFALDACVTGDFNTAVGTSALGLVTGDSNTAVGRRAGKSVSSGSNNLFLGYEAGITGSPGGAITTASNEIGLGDENISAANIQVDWTVASDQRDKTDFTALDLGLDFVKALAPFTYKWDKRSKYGDKSADDYDLDAQTPDGTHKEDWLDIGFKAQDVQALEEAAGYTTAAKKNLTVSTSSDGKQMGLQYSKFVPILVKALQELSAKNDALTARITALEGN